VQQDEDGEEMLAREKRIKIIDAWQNVMQAANYYFWPTGEAIRDYIVILLNAVNFWDSGSSADQNKPLLETFNKALAIMKISDVPKFDRFRELSEWTLGRNCPLMIALPRYKQFEDIGPSDAIGATFRQLDNLVNTHCTAERRKGRKNDKVKLAGEVKRAGARGTAVLAYFYYPGAFELEKCEPNNLMTYRFATKQVQKKDYESSIAANIILMSYMFIMSGDFSKWGSRTGIDTIRRLKDMAQRNSTQAVKDPKIPNEYLNNVRRNPRQPLYKEIIHGIISYGASRMKMEGKSDSEARALAAQKAGDKDVAIEEPKSVLDRLKETRLKASDSVDDSSMILPILLLGCAIFLLMK
jgi:hypothetical protein